MKPRAKAALRQLRTLICLMGTLLMLTACEDEDKPSNLYFVGDSIIDMWYTHRYFPSYTTHNLGVSGSKLVDLESRLMPPSDSIVVCQIGTNDLQFDFPTDADRSNYVTHYLAVVGQLSHNRVYLYSVLPSVRDDRDRNIPWFNDSIRARIHEYPHIVYLDVYQQFLAPDGKSLKENLTPDKLHLNDDGYNILAKALHDKLLE